MTCMTLRGWRFGLALLTLALCLAAGPSGAQLMMQSLTVSTRDWTPANSCANVDPVCAGPNRDLDLGPHEFDLYRTFSLDQPVEGASFRPVWPAAWTLLGWQTCSGTLVSGDPSVNGGNLTFTFPYCDEGPFLRYWFDCSVPGRFDAQPFGLVGCFGGPGGVWFPLHVDIGDFCGAYSYGPCSQCGLPGGYSGTFDPPSYTVTIGPGAVFTDTLQVTGDLGPWCYGLPECGGDGPGQGFNGIESNAEWLKVLLFPHRENGRATMSYQIRASAADLGPGIYEGRVNAPPGCRTKANCMPVTMVVLPELSGVVDPAAAKPVILGPPVPNPAHGAVSFALHLEEAAAVRVVVADASGRLVGQVLHETVAAGTTWRTWNPSQALRQSLPGGVYFLQLETPAGRESRMFVLRR